MSEVRKRKDGEEKTPDSADSDPVGKVKDHEPKQQIISNRLQTLSNMELIPPEGNERFPQLLEELTPPNEEDCCNSGCNPCIFDVYQEQVRRFKNKRTNTIQLKNCISEMKYTPFRLVNVRDHAKDVYVYTFQYVRRPSDDVDLSLVYKPGQYFLLKSERANEEFTRAYTPVPMFDSVSPDTALQFTILVRLYETGKMSNVLRRMRLGAVTMWRGPYGAYETNVVDYRHTFFIAQGTGIAPVYSIIKQMLADETCESFLKLFFCCRSCDQILLRDQLYSLLQYWNFTYEVFLTSFEDVGAKYNEVLHEKKMCFEDVEKFLLDKLHDVQVLLCGSESFTENILEYLERANLDSSRIFAF